MKGRRQYSGKIIYHFLALLVVAIWGVTFISTKVLINAGLHPSLIFAIRFAIAYAGIWIMGFRSKGAGMLFCPNLRDELLLAFLGITGGSVYFLAENTALAYTQACNVSFIVCSAPLLTALLTIAAKRFFKGELVDGLEDVGGRWTLALGSALAIAGMVAVIFDGNALQFSAKGDLLALAAAICWGLYSIFMSQMTEKYGTIFATRKVFFYGLVTVIPFLGGVGLPLEVFALPSVWGNLIFLALIASLFCFAVWNKVMPQLGNVTATNYVYLNPFFTLVAAVAMLGESLSLQSALGCTAIVAGVVVGGVRPRSEK